MPPKYKNPYLYTRFSFTVFSMFVAGSILAGFSVQGFYTVALFGTYTIIRGAFISPTYTGFAIEITHPDPVIKIVEACYMYRFESDLYNEEEVYRMLQEIIRQPELLKALSGSSLRGAMDPSLDKMTPEDQIKFKHLERLEAKKKFDVTKMKEELA